MKKIILIILAIFLLFSCNEEEDSGPVYISDAMITGTELSAIDIMSFNIQIFGRAKSSKLDVMNVIIDIIDDYDLIAIQEVRDNTDQSLTTLMAMMPDEYKIVVGPREGRSRSKEQAIYVYDDNILNVNWSFNFEDPEDVFERSPFVASFTTDDGKLTFQILNNHISPSEAEYEIIELAEAATEVLTMYEGYTIVVGDLNADGSYYKEENLSSVFGEPFEVVIGNEWNTTIGATNNTYDRIIISDELIWLLDSYGVLYFDDYLPEGLEAKLVSDHYPVWMTLEY